MRQLNPHSTIVLIYKKVLAMAIAKATTTATMEPSGFR
jgi:hypothetical protein